MFVADCPVNQNYLLGFSVVNPPDDYVEHNGYMVLNDMSGESDDYIILKVTEYRDFVIGLGLEVGEIENFKPNDILDALKSIHSEIVSL